MKTYQFKIEVFEKHLIKN